MKVMARRINAEDFSAFGRYFNMYQAKEGIKHTRGDSFEDHMTCQPIVDTDVHLGLTVGSAAPCAIVSMEKHSHTQEAILCMRDPILFCVAASRGNEAPRAEDLHAFLMEPGDVAIIEREVWHDACHGLGHDTPYYWLALAGKAPAVWEKVAGEVELTWDDSASGK